MASNNAEPINPLGPTRLPTGVAYQIIMIVISVYAVLAMLAVEVPIVSPRVRDLLEIVDGVVCLLFFVDFVVSVVRSENRWKYFFTWGWLDLISSIPLLGALRYLRIARVLRIIRVLRVLKATRLVTTFLLRQTRQTALVSIITVTFSLIIFGSVAVLAFEPGMGGHIDTAADALWWAICTVATVGYGDVVPVTMEGKVIAVILMTGGVGVFATMSGIIASSLVEAGEGNMQVELKRLTAVVSELTIHVEALRKDA